jgi:branched-chain amino acid transport system substrate-binding protein
MMKTMFRVGAVAAAALLWGAASAPAQTVKLGLILTYSGDSARLGQQIDDAVKLYVKLHEADLGGIKLDIIRRDDTGPSPETAKRLAQELITRDKVQMMAGLVFTPNFAAIAPILTDAHMPFVIMNAGTSSLTTLTPYVVRASFAAWQNGYSIGQWAAKHNIPQATTLVPDYTGGQDYEQAFIKGYTDAGGKVLQSIRFPLQSPDLVPYMQRIADSKPGALYIFDTSGAMATAIIKAFVDVGLDASKTKLLGPGDITDDAELHNFSNVTTQVVTALHYTVASDRPANKAFVAAWKKEYGLDSTPNFMSVGGWDGMDMVYAAIRARKGDMDPDKTMEVMRHYKSDASPRGPISIDPETRDIIQNVYIRELVRENGKLVNRDIDKIEAVKDPWKVINNKK